MTTLATQYTGSLAMRLAGAEELLVRSATFREKVGDSSIDDARKKVFAGELTLFDVLAAIEGEGGTLDIARPCAIIGVQGHSYVQIGQGGAIQMGAEGGVWILFIDNPSNPKAHKLSLLDFVDWTSKVADEIAAMVGSDVGADDYTLWPFSSIRMFLEPLRSDAVARKADDWWICGYALNDSLGGRR